MIHIFDVDETIIKKTSAMYFLLEALKQKKIRLWQMSRLPVEGIKYKLAIPNFDFIENAAKKFAGLNEKDFEVVANASFEKKIKKSIYAEAVKLIKEIQMRGEKIILATSSFDFMILPLAKYLNIDEIITSKLEFKDGKTTGGMIGESCFGVKKKNAVENWMEKNSVKPQDVCFYSDSYTDIPLLEYCGKAVAVNPDRILKKEAKKRNWEILYFKGMRG